MKKKLLGKLLSLSLSAVLAFGSFSTPAYAAELNLELTESEADAEELQEEVIDVETEEEVPEEDATEEEAPAEEEAPVEEEAPAEVEAPAEEEAPDEEAAPEEGTFDDGVTVDDTVSEEVLTEEIKEADDETEPVADPKEEAKGVYYLRFYEGRPENCISPYGWGYGDGQLVPTEVGAPIILSGDEFEIPGYELVGWTYTDAKGKTVKLNKPSATIPSLTDKEGEIFEFTPVWKLGTYTITYNFNGGTSKFSNKVTYQLDEKTVEGVPVYNYVADENGAFVINKENPEVTRKDYNFVGWSGYYLDSSYYGNTRFMDLELYAVWTPIVYDCVLDCDGGYLTLNGEDVPDYTFKNFSVEGWFRNYRPHKTGYSFVGWQAKENGKAKIFKPSEQVVLKNIDRDEDGVYRVKAVWKAEKCTITLELNGGKIAKAPKKYVAGDGTVIPTPTQDGYKFAGWTMEVLDDEMRYVTVDAEEAGYIKDGKLTEKAVGPLTLTAAWDELIYNIVFKSIDGSDLVGSDGQPVMGISAVTFWDEVDFTAAAYYLDETGALGEGKSVAGFAKNAKAKKADIKTNTSYWGYMGYLPKTYDGEGLEVTVPLYVVTQAKVYRIFYNTFGGEVNKPVYTFTSKNVAKDYPIKSKAVKKGWTFKGWTTSPEYDEYVVKKDGYVTAIKAGTAANIALNAEFVDGNKYTITLMPMAEDAFDADGKPIDSKNGVQCSIDGVTEFYYTDNEHVLDEAGNGWTRDGYYFGGFYADSKYKNYPYWAGGLGNGKSANVKVYAYWIPTTQSVEFEDSAEVHRGEVVYSLSAGNIGTKLYDHLEVATGSKDITPKAVKATGYNFLGWKLDSELVDDSGIEYTDASKTYVKKIKKTNKENVQLKAVFEEITYKVYVNPNGGLYNGSKAKTLVSDKVYYNESPEEVYDKIEAGAKRSGYNLSCASTTKDNKGTIVQTRRYTDGHTERVFRSRLANKQDAAVVLNLIWDEVDTVVPTMYKSNVRVEGDTLTFSTNYWPSEGYCVIEFEYSTTADFSKNVETYIWDKVEHDSEENAVYPSVKVTPGKNYYVRARRKVLDSTGEYFASKWSATVMATRYSEPLE